MEYLRVTNSKSIIVIEYDFEEDINNKELFKFSPIEATLNKIAWKFDVKEQDKFI